MELKNKTTTITINISLLTELAVIARTRA
jgi:hypothetical protein